MLDMQFNLSTGIVTPSTKQLKHKTRREAILKIYDESIEPKNHCVDVTDQNKILKLIDDFRFFSNFRHFLKSDLHDLAKLFKVVRLNPG
jgi:hypothetical protein